MGTRSKGQRSSDEFDPKTKELQSFLNQPNINMAIPWIYEIRNAINEGGGGAGGAGGGEEGGEEGGGSYEWEDLTNKSEG